MRGFAAWAIPIIFFSSATIALTSALPWPGLPCGIRNRIGVPLFLRRVSLIFDKTWSEQHSASKLCLVARPTQAGMLFLDSYGCWIVNILAMMFGVGCVIAYAYIGRECWSFLTGGKYLLAYSLIFCCMAVFGALADVRLLWNAIDIVNAGLIISNMWGLLWLMPEISKGVRAFYVHDRKRG